MTGPLALWRFWFEELTRAAWFTRDDTVDQMIRERFGSLPEQAVAGELRDWRATPKGTVALIVALDQLPRNLWRGEARAFAYDSVARAETDAAIARGVPAALSVDERAFLYLPLEHSEDLEDQDRCCELMEALGDAEYADYAHRHRDVVRRFGRFPHRNAALGRVSTLEEQEYLSQPGAGF